LAEILKDTATGGAASYLGQIASNAINSGKISNTKITQQAFDDAAFAAADAESLAKQGLSESQIKQTLVATGLSSTTAGSAAKMAADGVAAADIAVKLSNSAGANKNLYTDKQTGVQNSVIGGGNVEALETIQRIEDATFIAEDIKQLKAQGLSNSQIKDNLIMAGVDAKVAGNAVNLSGSTVDNIVKSLTSSSAYKATGFFVKDFDPATAQRDLGTAPAVKATTPAATTPAATTPDTTTPATTTPATTTPAVTTPAVTTPSDGTTVTFDDGSTITYDNTGRVLGSTNPDGTIYTPGSNPNLPVTTPTTPGTTTPATTTPATTTPEPGVVTPTTPPVNGETYTYDDGSTITIDKVTGEVLASTPATDTGPSTPLIPDTPTSTNRTVTYDDGSTITYDKDGNVIGSTDIDGNPYVPGSNPNLPINKPVTPVTPTNPLLPPPTFIPPYVPPERPTTPVDPYGPYTGFGGFGTVTPPDTTQGLNPGFMPGGRDYATTSPVQAQFDWSKTAYQPGPGYNPALQGPPPVPFGLQQMYTPMSPEQLLQLTQGANLYAGLLPTGTGR
jgi:SOS response regulatory protein OraA/RecX